MFKGCKSDQSFIQIHFIVNYNFLLPLKVMSDIVSISFSVGTVTVMKRHQKRKIIYRNIVIIFLSIGLTMCFGCSKEPSNRDGSFEYPQHMFWLRNKKNNFQLHTLTWRSDIGLNIRKPVFRNL